MAKDYSRATRRILGVVQNNLDRADDSKGALVVRALLSGMTDEEVFLHLVERGEVPSYASIRSYRVALRMLGREVRTDSDLRHERRAARAR